MLPPGVATDYQIQTKFCKVGELRNLMTHARRRMRFHVLALLYGWRRH